jgi:hypothetical protein
VTLREVLEAGIRICDADDGGKLKVPIANAKKPNHKTHAKKLTRDSKDAAAAEELPLLFAKCLLAREKCRVH